MNERIPAAFLGYAKAATAGIDDRGERQAAAAEIVDHMMARLDDERASGRPEADAVDAVLASMGSARELTHPLEDAHTPRWRWGVVLAIVVGAVVVFALIWLAFASAMPG
ncbi:MAG: hypothetical protein QM713_05625 [Arachnia sp.]